MSLPIPLLWKLRAKLALSSFGPPDGFPSCGPRLIVALAADYGNLGDVALTRALVRFGAAHLPSHAPYLLTAGGFFGKLRGVARASGPEDVIAIVGGGNMGDLYPDLEEARLQTIRAFPRNRIISFPQSIEFSDSASGRRQYARSRDVYQSHPNFEMFARETESLQRMRSAFPGVRVSLAPDTVLSMEVAPGGSRSVPLMVCLRQDKEAGLLPERRSALLATLQGVYPGALVGDTLVEGPRLSFPLYERHLERFLAQISGTRCVVTDRLHGLIFSVITNTPCVVIENNNHKIRATVESWLSDVSSVRLLSNPGPDAVLEAIEQVRVARVSRPDLAGAFAPLAAALKR